MCFFFNDTATTEIYTLSLHDALPISFAPRAPDLRAGLGDQHHERRTARERLAEHVVLLVTDAAPEDDQDRKSTRLNSSHANISYAVFCLKKKTKTTNTTYGTWW